jgi:membrane-bound serine protease (ClpP class)
VESQVVDVVADDLADLLARLEGRTVTVRNGEVTLDLAAAAVEEYPMTWLQVIAHGIVDPNIAYILLSLGIIALIAEFYHPGAILPGVTGVISLILAFVALGSLPVNWGGIALIGLAFVFFMLDIKITGFALSVAGAISFVLGSLLLFSPFRPGAPAMPRLAVSPWLLAGMTMLLVGFFSLALTAALRAQRRTALMGTQALVGATGIALSDLDPLGVVQVRSETWTAMVEVGSVNAGERVEVIGIEGLRLRVRRPS